MGQAVREIEIVYGNVFMCLAGRPGCGRRREKQKEFTATASYVLSKEAVWDRR